MKTSRIIAALSALTLIFSACEREDLNKETDKKDAHTVTFLASVDGTKTDFTGTAGNYSTNWSVGDYIYITEWFEGEHVDGYTDYNEDRAVQSDALTAAADVASFTASFYYDVNPTKYVSGTMKFKYFATTTYALDYNADQYGNPMYTLNMPTMQKVLPGDTPTTPNKIDIASDLLVSQIAETTERPSELKLKFARVGTIVKINLSGLPANATVSGGYFYTGDNFYSTCSMEAMNYFWPLTGEYSVQGGDNYVQFYTDSSTPVVTDADGKVSILLRTFAGEIDDWFSVFVDIEDGDDTVTYSKYVDLETAGKTLAFKESGVTEFSVALKPAQANAAPDVDYTTSESANHDGFFAVWAQDEHAAGYKCYYFQRDENDNVTGRQDLTVNDLGSGYVGVSVPSGMEKDTYYLRVQVIPDSESGPSAPGAEEVELAIGYPIYIIMTMGNTTEVSDGLYYAENQKYNPYPGEGAYFYGSNVNTNYSFASADGATAWYIMTSYSQTFPGGLTELQYNLENWGYDGVFSNPNIYGILGDTNHTEVELEYTSKEEVPEGSDKHYTYKYDLSGYAGFKISGTKDSILDNIYLSYYK